MMRALSLSHQKQESWYGLSPAIIPMVSRGVKRVYTPEQNPSERTGALECRHGLDWERRHRSDQRSAGPGVGAKRRDRLPTLARVVSGCGTQTWSAPP